jgi:hypothetical protein
MGLLDDIFDAVATPILNKLSTVVEPVLSAIWDQVTYLVNRVYQWLKDVAAWIWGYISPYVTPLLEKITQIWDTLKNLGSSIYQWVTESINTIANSILSTVKGVWNWIQDAVYTVTLSLSSFFNYMLNSLSSVAKSILNNLSAVYSGILTWFEGNVLGSLSTLYNAVFAWLQDVKASLTGITTAITAKIEDLKIGTYAEIFKLATTQAVTLAVTNDVQQNLTGLGDTVSKALSALGHFLYDKVKDLFGWIFEHMREIGSKIKDFLVEMVVPGLTGAGSKLLEWIKSIIGKVWDQIYDLLVPSSEFEVMGTWTRSKNLMMAGGVTLGGLGIASVLGELVHPLKELGLGKMSALVYDLAGWQWIMSAIIGTVAYVSLRTPLRYQFNALVRPRVPDERDLITMVTKEDIDLDVFKKVMPFYGYSDYWIGNFIKTMYREPRYFELRLMAEGVPVDMDWLLLKSIRMQFTRDDAEIMAEALKWSSLKDEVTALKSLNTALYKAGRISEDEFRANLVRMKYDPEWVEIITQLTKQQMDIEIYQTLGKAALDAFKYNMTSKEDCIEALIALGFRKEWIEAEIYSLELYKARNLYAAEKERTLSASQITSAVDKGIRDRDWGMSRLTALGYTSEDAEILLALKIELEEVA